MSQFGVRVNGVPKYIGGTVNLNGVTIDSQGRVGNFLTLSGTQSAAGGIWPNGNSFAFLQSTVNGVMAFTDATLSTGAQLNMRTLNFGVPASTFAQTATITNGPRAANPVAWVEVFVNNSSGRIAVW